MYRNTLEASLARRVFELEERLIIISDELRTVKAERDALIAWKEELRQRVVNVLEEEFRYGQG
jgi:hypothetical protein